MTTLLSGAPSGDRVLPSTLPPSPSLPSPISDPAELDLLWALRTLRFGAVEVIVHDGRVVQLERRGKTRYDVHGRR